MKSRLTSIKTLSKKGKRFYKPIRYPIIPLSIDDIYIVTTSGDRLDLLANNFYNDIRLWWIISIANRDIIKRDSYGLIPGLEIRIPQDTQNILSTFEELNK
tara:strand:- start:1089 stop:1391 length:303 start_codon:yes stop_codon:yes gene_type:complete